jgi:hypothetical protein
MDSLLWIPILVNRFVICVLRLHCMSECFIACYLLLFVCSSQCWHSNYRGGKVFSGGNSCPYVTLHVSSSSVGPWGLVSLDVPQPCRLIVLGLALKVLTYATRSPPCLQQHKRTLVGKGGTMGEK